MLWKYRKPIVVGTTCALVLGGAGIAHAAGSDAGGWGDTYVFYNDWSGDISFEATAGTPQDKVFTGDWDGNGADAIATRGGIKIDLYSDDEGNPPTESIRYWTPTDRVISGDWDGDGITTFGVRRGDTFYLQNSFGDGAPDAMFEFGENVEQVIVGDKDLILVGDFDGDGRDGIALRNGNEFTILDDVTSSSTRTVTFGPDASVDVIAVGDWNGDGIDTPLVRKGTNEYLAYDSWNYADGPAHEVAVGGAHNAVLVGDWNGDGKDTLGLRNYTKVGGGTGQISKDITAALVDTPEWRLRSDAAESLERVINTWGSAFQINSAFRPYDVQREIFLARYAPRAAGQGGGEFCDVKTWDGVQYVRTSPLGSAAVPGTSNHGSGRAIDIGGFDGFSDPRRLQWLDLARDFGWNDAEGCAVGEWWHMVYDPAKDKGSSDWSPNDPIDKSASNCPNKGTLSGGSTTPSKPTACKWG